MKIIPTRVHGILDYLMALTLVAIPAFVDWPSTAETILMVMGVGVFLYSLMTDYELGAFRVLPMGVHLALDLMGGLVLLTAPFLFFSGHETAQMVFMILGAGEILATLLTHTSPSRSMHTAR